MPTFYPIPTLTLPLKGRELFTHTKAGRIDFLDFKGPVLFRSQKEEVRQKRTYMDAISSEPEGMEVRELMAGHNVVKRLSGKTTC